MIFFKQFFSAIFFFSLYSNVWSQCCSGGSGSPIAGGASQGVLQERQVDINANYQYIHTTKFFTKDKRDTNFLDRFGSNYLYTRLGYGVTKNLTMSVETGYWINKTQVGKNKSDTMSSTGFGDLILFPRYDIINLTTETSRTELTIGLGIKIPLGSYNDSIETQIAGFYKDKPLAVQPSSGSNDIIFYAFFFKGYPQKNLRLFTNALYVRKGWNPLGEKIGDYASIGLFVGKTFFGHLGVTLQVKGEWVDQMKINEDILLYSYLLYDPLATGSKKVFIAPQISYSFKDNFTVYVLNEFPVYQYLTNTQIGSQYLITFGISYRFFAVRNILSS